MKTLTIVLFLALYSLALNSEAQDVTISTPKTSKKTACPNNDFEEFVRVATARGESASKYAKGKIERYRELRLAPLGGENDRGFAPVFDKVDADRVDSRFYDPEILNKQIEKRGFPDRLTKPKIYGLNRSVYTLVYSYEGTEHSWAYQFEPVGNCFRFVGYKSFDRNMFKETIKSFPKYADSGLRLLVHLQPLFISGELSLDSFPVRTLRYSSTQVVDGKEKVVDTVFTKKKDFAKLQRFPSNQKFNQPMDQSKWALSVDWVSANQVIIFVGEKTESADFNRFVEYYFSAYEGVMFLTHIVDKNNLLKN